MTSGLYCPVRPRRIFAKRFALVFALLLFTEEPVGGNGYAACRAVTVVLPPVSVFNTRWNAAVKRVTTRIVFSDRSEPYPYLLADRTVPWQKHQRETPSPDSVGANRLTCLVSLLNFEGNNDFLRRF